MSTTEKDREVVNAIYNACEWGAFEKAAEVLEKHDLLIRADTADQARKEAADIQCSFCERQVQCKLPEFCQKRSAIFGDSPATEPKQTDAEKLATAIRHLKEIRSIGNGSKHGGDFYGKLADNALKEIQI